MRAKVNVNCDRISNFGNCEVETEMETQSVTLDAFRLVRRLTADKFKNYDFKFPKLEVMISFKTLAFS